MEEKSINEVTACIKNQKFQPVYFYTTMCGTCQLASKMLQIVSHALGVGTIFKCNVNYAGKFAQEWEIESVPCLIIFCNNKIVKKIYAFHSVDYLYKLLKSYVKS